LAQKLEAVIRISRKEARDYLEGFQDVDQPSEKQVDKLLETIEQCFMGPEKDLEAIFEIAFEQWMDWEAFR